MELFISEANALQVLPTPQPYPHASLQRKRHKLAILILSRAGSQAKRRKGGAGAIEQLPMFLVSLFLGSL